MIETPSSEDIKSWASLALDKLRSPFFGAAIMAWPLINYRFFVVLFSDNGVQWTFDYIDTRLYESDAHRWLQWYLYPLIAGAYYAFFHDILRECIELLRKHMVNIAKGIAVKNVFELYTERQFQEKNFSLIRDLNEARHKLENIRRETDQTLSSLRQQTKDWEAHATGRLLELYAESSKVDPTYANPTRLIDNAWDLDARKKAARVLAQTQPFATHMAVLEAIILFARSENRYGDLLIEEIYRSDPSIRNNNHGAFLALHSLHLIRFTFGIESTGPFYLPERGALATSLLAFLKEAQNE